MGRAAAIIAVWLLAVQWAGAQSRQFDRDGWRQLTKDLEYREEIQQQEVAPKAEPPAEEKSYEGLSMPWQIIGTIAIGVAVLIGVILLIRKWGWWKPGKQAESLETTVDAAEADLPDTPLAHLLEEALSQENYRMALRLHFLQILQALHRHQWIAWQPYTTNTTYLRQLRNAPFYEDVFTLTRWYETVWYGSQPLEREAYLRVVAPVASLMDQIAHQKTIA